MINIEINGINYPLRSGSVFTENQNETLDSADITIDSVSEKLLLNPFDEVILTGDNFTTRYMCIDSYVENIVSFNPKKYEYVIKLFSRTKLLENIVLPNLSITKSKIVGERHSVYFYIQNYIAYYGSKIKIPRTGGGWTYDNKWVIDLEVRNLYDSIECPEFQWNTPTLREVLTDLFLVCDKLPIIDNHTIKAYDISKTGNQIDTSKLNYIQASKTSSDAISALHLNMKNAVQSKKTNVRNTVKSVEYVGFRNEINHILTDDNIQIILRNPIYNIISIKACFSFHYSTDPDYPADGPRSEYREFEMVDFVKEKSAYDVLKTTPLDHPELGDPSVSQQLNVYYTRNNNKIEGWGQAYDGLSLLVFPYSTTPIASIMKWLIYSIAKNYENPFGWGYTIDEKDVVFKIEYETSADAVCSAGKYLPAINERVVSDNQTSSYVDSNANGIFEYSKVNRLGNEMLVIYGEYNNESEAEALGNMYDDSIIFTKETTLSDYGCLCKYIATKNYVLQNYFTSVKSKIRSWQYASESDALTRHDIKKYYCEFGFNKKIDKIDIDYNLVTYFSTPLYFYNPKPIDFCMIYAVDINSVVYPPLPASVDANGTAIEDEETGFGYQMELDSKIIGNSIILSYGFEDNIIVDRWVKNEDNFITVIPNQKLYKYVDKNGENNGMRAYFLTEINPTDNAFTWPVDGEVTTLTKKNQMSACQRKKPLVRYANNENKVFYINDYRYKDNREIHKLSLQFEFCSDDPKIIVTQKFIERQKMINTLGNQANIKVYATNTIYKTNETAPHMDALIANNLIFTHLSNYSNKIEIDGSIGTYKYWCITDNNNNMLIAVNSNVDEIYLNILFQRNNLVYDSNYKAIGTITGADDDNFIVF